MAFLATFLSLIIISRWAVNTPETRKSLWDKPVWIVRTGQSIYPRLTWKHVVGYEHLPDIPDVRET